jgi:hypothetical protein
MIIHMQYFVYLHKRKTDGIVFYVGKGCRYRHKSLWNRSQHWKNVVAKHGYTIEIVAKGMTEKEAFELEKKLISEYKSDKLCNRTLGGEGTSGLKVSEETKRKHKELRNTLKWRANLSKKAKERFANPEFRKAHAERIRKYMRSESVREKIRQAAIKQFSNPLAREKLRQGVLRHFSNPKAIEVLREKALARFDTPEKRSAHVQAKAILCVEANMTFGTSTLAAEWLRATTGRGDNSQICKACRGIVKSAYGYTWKFVKQAMEVRG